MISYAVSFTIKENRRKIIEKIKVTKGSESETLKLSPDFRARLKIPIGFALSSLVDTNFFDNKQIIKFTETWGLDSSDLEEIKKLSEYKNAVLSSFKGKKFNRFVFFFYFFKFSGKLNNELSYPVFSPPQLYSSEVIENLSPLEREKFSKIKEEIETGLRPEEAEKELESFLSPYLPKYLGRIFFHSISFIALCSLELAFIFGFKLKIKICPYCSSFFVTDRGNRFYCAKCKEEGLADRHKAKVYRNKDKAIKTKMNTEYKQLYRMEKEGEITKKEKEERWSNLKQQYNDPRKRLKLKWKLKGYCPPKK